MSTPDSSKDAKHRPLEFWRKCPSSTRIGQKPIDKHRSPAGSGQNHSRWAGI
jgi:hypothetical protein